jgi:hypothetical protein
MLDMSFGPRMEPNSETSVVLKTEIPLHCNNHAICILVTAHQVLSIVCVRRQPPGGLPLVTTLLPPPSRITVPSQCGLKLSHPVRRISECRGRKPVSVIQLPLEPN